MAEEVEEVVVSSTTTTTTNSALIEGLNEMRLAGKFTDVTLVVQGRRFKAHRVVLAASSDYFNAMFSIGMVESVTEEIHLMGVTANALANIIEFIYTSNLQLNCDNIEEVLQAGTHIQMEAAIEACVKYLRLSLSMNNCLDVALLADRYSQADLKDEVYRFVCSQMSIFAARGFFMKLSADEVHFLLSSCYPVDVTEFELLRLTLQWCAQDKHKNDADDVKRRLFAGIFFKNIPNDDLQQLHDEIREKSALAAADGITLEGEELEIVHDFKLMCLECKLQKPDFQFSSMQNGTSPIQEIVRPPKIVCNTRGMELSLLKVGGIEVDGLTNTISSFSPTHNEWRKLTIIPHLDQCNYGTAVLMNKLFIIGGSYDVCLREYVHPFGFCYCPLQDRWECLTPLQTERCRFSLNAVGNRHLYAVGGIEDLDNDANAGWNGNTSNVERYNIITSTWTYMPRLRESRSQHAGVTIGDKLYISGGINGSRVLNSFWCFDTKTLEWTQLTSMLYPRCDHALVEVNNKIYACGGWRENLNETREIVDVIEVYDQQMHRWSYETLNPHPTFHTGITVLNDVIYFVGGLQSNDTADRATSHTFTYNVTTRDWNHSANALNDVWEMACVGLYLPKYK